MSEYEINISDESASKILEKFKAKYSEGIYRELLVLSEHFIKALQQKRLGKDNEQK